MGNITNFLHKKHICLLYASDLHLIGIDPQNHIFVEEYYEHAFIAQHHINADGEIIETRDEDFGKQDILLFPTTPEMLISDEPDNHPLNYLGNRRRGIRETDRVAEWVKPLPIMEKMPLIQHLNLNISPMMLMGISESRVLAAAKLSQNTQLVCRCVRLLIALSQPQKDEYALVYDYDTIPLYLIHEYDLTTETAPPLYTALQSFPELAKPTDIILHENMLYVADSGAEDRKSEIHIYQLEQHNTDSMLD